MKKLAIVLLTGAALVAFTAVAWAATETTGYVSKLTITASSGLAQVFTKNASGTSVMPCSGHDKVYAYFHVTDSGGDAMHRTFLSAKLSGAKVWMNSEWSDGKCWVTQAQIR